MQRASRAIAVYSLVSLSSLAALSQTPQITKVSPPSAPIGMTVTIYGTNLGSYNFGTGIMINNGEASPPAPMLWTSTEIQVIVPPTAAQGSGTITVCPQAGCSNAYPFTVTNTYALQTANNTSACSSSSNSTNNPSYCGSNYFNGLTDTKNPKSSLQTYVVDSPAAQMSLTQPLRSLFSSTFSPGWVVCEYQPWFGDPNHKSVGYDESNPATVHSQVSNMITRGCNVVLVDWYNQSIGNGFEYKVEGQLYADISNREDPNYGSGTWPPYPIYFAAMEDQGNWSASCPPYQPVTAISEAGNTVTVTTAAPSGAAVGSSVSITGVPVSGYNGTWTVSSVLNSYQFTYVDTQSGLASSNMGTAGIEESSCIESALETDLKTIHDNYMLPPYVLYTPTGNANSPSVGYLVAFFICESCFNADWANTIWPAIESWIGSNWNLQAAQAYLFNEYGAFGTNPKFGEYGWPQPLNWSSSNQYVWDYSSYLTNFYAAAQTAYTNDLEGGIGVVYKGFDDTNASWGKNRVMAQQCGQVWYQTAQFPTSDWDHMDLMQVATWNDYEEGTEIETGIDNCYTVAGSISNGILSWTLNKSSSYAKQQTINHFTIWYADSGGNLFLAKDNISASARSQSLTAIIPTGTWTVYVEMVGQSSIINRMSNGSPYTH